MHKLTENFTAFFKRINPSLSYEQIAARAQAQITNLIEDKAGPAGDLRIKCFLQGSYRRDTAIHTINDVDIVALCSLSHSSNANYNTRNQIFGMIAKAIAKNKVYSDKIKYRNRSICIKILLEGVKIEILPALRMKGQNYTFEPFYIFQPEIGSNGNWIEAFARQHQKLCTKKNSKTSGFFIPMIKVFKHLRFLDAELAEENAVSFHIECLLYTLKNSIYSGSYPECIESVLKAIAGFSPEKAQHSKIKSPCRDKYLFDINEWNISSYKQFYKASTRWYELAATSNNQTDRNMAINTWKQLLGDNYFPRKTK